MVTTGQDQQTMLNLCWFQSQEETITSLRHQLEQTNHWNKKLNNHLYTLTTENKLQRQEILGLRSQLEVKDQEIVDLKGKLPNPLNRIRRRRSPTMSERLKCEIKKQRVLDDSSSLTMSYRTSQESPETPMTQTSTPSSSNTLSMCATLLATMEMPPAPDFTNYTFTGNVHFDGKQFTFDIGGNNHGSDETLQPDEQEQKIDGNPITSFQDALAFWKQNYKEVDRFGTPLFGLDISSLLFNPNGSQVIPQRVIKIRNEREFQEMQREKRGQKWEKLSDFRKNQWKEKLGRLTEIQKEQLAAGLIVFLNENCRPT
ncbi:hypothetical protein CRE_06487 [Caenorhabditis remanei]|uniref:Uncharacterized protein n=1 Tax=Caenorhabditis remanei TaxID=31234 RepID=E3M0Y6_CAERE|nr:hypothetical protein CRE_06487 [Caenorhabditis remanei]